MEEEVITTIKSTKNGRRYFSNHLSDCFYTWETGYVEIDKDMPLDYYDDRYKILSGQVGGGLTFGGYAFPNFETSSGNVVVMSPMLAITRDDFINKALMSEAETVLVSFNEKYSEEAERMIEAGNFIRVVGFDSNHAFGNSFDVPSDTKMLAENFEELMKAGVENE